ncbi:MAG: hypothetical protein HFE33_05220 [Clostridia bacterium]|nr:hypothetical protein [Clostridia bacterium]
MSPRTGRPKEPNSKSLRFTFRLSEETAKDLEECAKELKTSKAQVVEKGIQLVKKQIEE